MGRDLKIGPISTNWFTMVISFIYFMFISCLWLLKNSYKEAPQNTHTHRIYIQIFMLILMNHYTQFAEEIYTQGA